MSQESNFFYLCQRISYIITGRTGHAPLDSKLKIKNTSHSPNISHTQTLTLGQGTDIHSIPRVRLQMLKFIWTTTSTGKFKTAYRQIQDSILLRGPPTCACVEQQHTHLTKLHQTAHPLNHTLITQQNTQSPPELLPLWTPWHRGKKTLNKFALHTLHWY